MNNIPKPALIILGSLSLVTAVLLVFLFFYNRSTSDKSTTNVVTTPLISTSTEGFPSDFPFEKGSKVFDSYQAENKSEFTNQTTRTYETNKSLAENYEIFNKYFKDNNWVVESNQSGSSYRTIIARNKDLVVQVSITENKTTKIKTVSASVLK